MVKKWTKCGYFYVTYFLAKLKNNCDSRVYRDIFISNYKHYLIIERLEGYPTVYIVNIW